MSLVRRPFLSAWYVLVVGLLLALPLAVFAQSDDAGMAFGLASSALSLVCCVAWFIINIFILIWVYNDANKRGANGLLWALIVLVAGILGLLLYFAVGRNQRTI
jgi:uncharacterized membrane protein YhaH (DUF805 family)